MSIADEVWERAEASGSHARADHLKQKRKSSRIPWISETKLVPSPTSTLRKVSGETLGKIFRGKEVRMFPRRESKQPAAKAKENVEAFGAEGEEVRRWPGRASSMIQSWSVTCGSAPSSSKGTPKWRRRRRCSLQKARRWMIFGARVVVICLRTSRACRRKSKKPRPNPSWPPKLGRQKSSREGVGRHGLRANVPSSFLIRTLFHRPRKPQARDLLSTYLWPSFHDTLQDYMCRKLVSLKRRAAHWTLLRLRALNFFLYDIPD